ncbi:uncharacterized protein FFMR_04675 [Fusarium fujikuroi]|nr:uncharacterized protein FFMR_04675 [Fusarium fujikuroi]
MFPKLWGISMAGVASRDVAASLRQRTSPLSIISVLRASEELH